jgi:NCAIR mutase (PurE)-related protein
MKPADEFLLDLDRRQRIGMGEAVYCAGKSAAQISAILQHAAARDASLLLTRLESEQAAALPPHQFAALDYDEISRTAYAGPPIARRAVPPVAIVTAGTSDVPVAREAVRSLHFEGVATEAFFDVGVAGLWRLLRCVDRLRRHPIVIVVAGMDAALPSVVAGLVPGLVIAVPTSVGYGVAAGGQAALNALLASCASGLVVVNIDNGYGAACAALRAIPCEAGVSDVGEYSWNDATSSVPLPSVPRPW